MTSHLPAPATVPPLPGPSKRDVFPRTADQNRRLLHKSCFFCLGIFIPTTEKVTKTKTIHGGERTEEERVGSSRS